MSTQMMSCGSLDGSDSDDWMICTIKDVYPDANQLEHLIVSEGTELISVLVLLDRESHDTGFGCFGSGFILFKVLEVGSYHKFPEGPTGYWMRNFCDIFSEFQGKWVLVELPSSMELFPSNPSMWWRRSIVYNDDDDDDDDCSTHDSVTSMTSDEDEEDMDGIRVMPLSMACDIIINYGRVELVMGLVTGGGVPSVMYQSENVIDDDLDSALCT